MSGLEIHETYHYETSPCRIVLIHSSPRKTDTFPTCGSLVKDNDTVECSRKRSIRRKLQGEACHRRTAHEPRVTAMVQNSVDAIASPAQKPRSGTRGRC